VGAPLLLATDYATGIPIQPGGTTGFTERQAKDLAVEIGDGGLPLSLDLTRESTVSLPPAPTT